MKILLVSQIPPYFEQFRTSDEIFPQMQAQAHWLSALKELDHNIEVFLYSDPVIGSAHFWAGIFRSTQTKLPRFVNKFRSLRNKYFNYLPDNLLRSIKLRNLILNFKPDVILISGGVSELQGLSLPLIKSLKIPLVLIHGVHPDQGATAFEKREVGKFDLIVTNDPTHARAWKKLGAKKTVTLPYSGINPNVHKDLNLNRSKDVVFAGTLFQERLPFLEQMLDQGIDYRLYGYIPKHVILTDKLKQIYKGEVWGNEIIKLFNTSKIVVNLVPDHMPVGGNLRTFEIPACGAIQFANRCPDSWFKTNQEIVLFDSAADLKNKISYYLKYDAKRLAIAKAGYQKVHSQYTYKNRFKQILKLI